MGDRYSLFVDVPSAIIALPVAKLVEDDAHIYLWTTNPHMRPCVGCYSCLGVLPKAMLTWMKPPEGMVGLGASTRFGARGVRSVCRSSHPYRSV